MLAFDRHEPEVAGREAEIAVHFDIHILGVAHEGPLDEQAVFIGQQMDTHFEKAIFLAAVVRDSFFGRENGKLFDMRKVQRLIGFGFDLECPALEVAEGLTLASDEQFGGCAFLWRALLGPAVRNHLHRAAADRFQTHGAQHCHGEK